MWRTGSSSSQARGDLLAAYPDVMAMWEPVLRSTSSRINMAALSSPTTAFKVWHGNMASCTPADAQPNTGDFTTEGLSARLSANAADKIFTTLVGEWPLKWPREARAASAASFQKSQPSDGQFALSLEGTS
jgi:hypothetical protein